MKILSDMNLKNALYVESPHNLGTLADDRFRNYVDELVEGSTLQDFMSDYSDLRQALILAIHALNQIPNTRNSEYGTTYKLISKLENTLKGK